MSEKLFNNDDITRIFETATFGVVAECNQTCMQFRYDSLTKLYSDAFDLQQKGYIVMPKNDNMSLTITPV